MIKLFSLTLPILVLSLTVFSKEPSSEIPAKREFPVNTSINPCDDFHKYVCSNVEASFKLREDRSYHDFAFSDSSERLLEAKKSFFSNIKNEAKLTARDLQVKNYYLACMDEKSGIEQEKVALKRLQSELENIKTAEQFALYNTNNIAKGRESLYQFDIDSNKDNPKIYDLFLMTSLMNLPEHTYYENKELMADYRNIIIDYFKITEPGLKKIDYDSKADNLIAFEKEFVNIYPHPEVRRQRWSEKRQELQTDFINKYANLKLKSLIAKAPSNLFVTNPIPEALEFLNKKMTNENLKTLKDFYSYSYGYQLIDDSNPEFFNKTFAFRNKYLGGPNARAQRHERCTKSVMNSFTKELDALMLPRMFPKFPEAKLNAVAKKIRESILSGLNKNSWLSLEAKKKAILKIEKAKLYLVKPQNNKEWDFNPIRTYSDKSRINNSILLRTALHEKKIKEVKAEVNQEAWGMGPLVVNAYYDPSANKFVLPIGILQYPFFDAEGGLIENLGAVGAVLGHELGHGIDDQGSKFDESGKLSQWMSMNDLKEFSSRGQRMIVQFNMAGHNGALTLGENVADLVGLTFAYNAAFPEGQGSQEDKRKLFTSYARVWCYVARPKMEENQLKTDPHSLGWARINEQVKHQKGFAEAFQCKDTDKMSLPDSERIKIW